MAVPLRKRLLAQALPDSRPFSDTLDHRSMGICCKIVLIEHLSIYRVGREVPWLEDRDILATYNISTRSKAASVRTSVSFKYHYHLVYEGTYLT